MTYSRNGKFKYRPNIKGKTNLTALDGERLETLRTLIANLIIDDEQAAAGIFSRLHEQGKHEIKPEILPDNLKFERLVLKTMYRLEMEKIPATRENLLMRMRLDSDGAEEGLDNLLLNYRTTPTEITFMAFSIHDWAERQRLIRGLQEALMYAQSDMFSEEAYLHAEQIMTEIAPNRYTDASMTGSEAADDFMRRRLIDEERMLAGKRLAPSFLWKGLNDKIQNWRPGEMMVIQAQTKHGKTTVGIMCCEGFAYGDLVNNPPTEDEIEDKESYYDVAFFHLESEQYDMHERIVARHLRIPGDQMPCVPILAGNKNPKLKKDLENWNARVKLAEKKRGHLHYLYRPGINLTRLRHEVKELKAKADARGRELIVVIDYYGVMDWTDLASDSTRGYNELATRLKSDVADGLGVRVLVFAQRNIDAASTGKKTAFNGSMLTMRSQIVIQLERGVAQENLYITHNGKPAKDGLGNDAYMQKVGEASSDAVFNILFASRNPAGKVPIKFFNPYFHIIDNPGGPLNVE